MMTMQTPPARSPMIDRAVLAAARGAVAEIQRQTGGAIDDQIAREAISAGRLAAAPFMDASEADQLARSARPVIKWCGGKSELAPELLRRMPARYLTYWEPFAGGAALFFAARPERQVVLSDTNGGLIGVYQAVRDHVEALIVALELHAKMHRRRGARWYRRVRDAYNEHLHHAPIDPTDHHDPVTRAAMFIYLNKTCFNGLWRENRAGAFNVPCGRYTNPKICDADNLRAAAAALAGVRLQTAGYDHVSPIAGDFVYFDPPYDPVSKTASFTRYAAAGFGREQQVQLADFAKGIVERGAHVMLSNSDTRFIRTLYRQRGFRVERVMCRRSINSAADKRGAIAEVVITSDYQRRGAP